MAGMMLCGDLQFYIEIKPKEKFEPFLSSQLAMEFKFDDIAPLRWQRSSCGWFGFHFSGRWGDGMRQQDDSCTATRRLSCSTAHPLSHCARRSPSSAA